MKTTTVAPRIRHASSVLAALLWAGPALATTLYWDPNTAAAGWGATTDIGTWGMSAFWTADSAGGFSDNGIDSGTSLPWVTTAADVVRINSGSLTGFTMGVSGEVHAQRLISAASGSANVTTITNADGGSIHLYGVGIATPAYNGDGGNSPITINAPIVLEQAVDSIVYLGTGGGNQGSTTIAGGITSTNSVNLCFGRVHNTTVSGSVDIRGNITGAVPYNNKAEYGVTVNADIGSNVTNVEQKSETARLLVLSGTNSYTGTTTATSGILKVTKTASLPGYDSPARVVFNGGLLTIPVGGGSDWTTAQVDTLLSNATKTGGTLGIDTTSGDLTQWTAFTTTNFGSVGLTKRGTNALTLNLANTYTGMTAVDGGVLRASDGTGLPAASPLMINDGVIETSVNLVRAAGTAAGQMALDGKLQTPALGFSAKGGPVKVCFGSLASPTILTWGTSTSNNYSGPFNTGSGGVFILNAATADNTIEFMNPLSLGTAAKTVQVNANVATLSGVLGSGSNGGPTKTGNGTLVLSNTNTYIGPTTISAGVLRATQGGGLPNGSYLKLNGGVYETSGTFKRVNSTTASGTNFQWSANNGGFSAYGGKLTVTINNDAATEQVWVAANTNNGIRGTLKLGSTTANAETEFQNKINLGDAARTIDVATGTGGDFATISGVISSTTPASGALTKTGTGKLVLTNANTYTGATTITGGTLALSGSGVIASSSINIQSAAILDVSALSGGWTLGDTQTLRGTGTLSGTTTSSGIVAPGASVGTLSVTGGFTFATGSTLAVEIGAGIAQVETATAVGTATADGNVEVTVTGAGIAGSPVTVIVPVLTNDAADVWAGKVRTALAGNPAITALYAIGGSGDAITLTRLVLVANDATLNLALANGTPDPGITPAATSFITATGTTPAGTDRFAVSGPLDISGATLDLAITGTLTAQAYVIASYGAGLLTGKFTDVSGTPLPDDYAINYAYNSGTAIAIRKNTGGNTYADWLANNGPATGFDTDSDNDGNSNGIEHILGSNPNIHSAGLTQLSATATSVTFQHTLNPAVASDVTRSYQWSTDLVEWKASGETNSGGTTATITPSGPDGTGVVTVPVTITAGPAGKLFGRLVATQLP